MAKIYYRHRWPKMVIGSVAKYYYRYKLSLRDLSEILLDRGIDVSHESIRCWVYKFGPKYAECLRKNPSQRFTDQWHRDEIHGKIQGQAYWLWRDVDSKGQEIDILRQPRRSVLTDFFEKYWGKITILIPKLLGQINSRATENLSKAFGLILITDPLKVSTIEPKIHTQSLK